MTRINGLRLLGIDTENIRGNATTCPKCSDSRRKKRDRCLSVNMETGNYYCNHCDFRGRADSDEWIQKQEEKKFEKPKEVKKSNIKPFRTGPISQEGIAFFKGRKISEKTLRENRVAEHKGFICFNYYDGDEIVKAKYRGLKDKKFYQHAGCPNSLYNLNGIKQGNFAIICEGEIDVLSFYEAGFNKAVSVDQGAPNVEDANVDAKLKCLDTCSKYLKRLDKIYIAVDKDPNGRRLEKELVRRLGRSKCWIVNFPDGCKDANEVLVKHSIKALKDSIASAKPFPVVGVITLDSVYDKMIDQFKNGVSVGYPTRVRPLDKHFRWMPGDLNVFTGLPNMGKSEFVKFLMVAKALLDGWKWAIFTPEHYPAEDFYIELIETMVGKSCDASSMDKMDLEEFEAAAKIVKDFFFFVYPEENESTSSKDALHTPDNIIDKIKDLTLRKGINGYLIDPWNQLMHISMESREDLYLAVELSKFDRLNKEYGLCGSIVAHPKAIPPNKDGIIRKPSGYDISGGPMWMNKAYNVVVVHRQKVDGKYTSQVEIDVQKVKKQKRVGRPGACILEFDVSTGWYFYFDDDKSVSPLKDVFRLLIMGEKEKPEKKVVNLSDHQMMRRARGTGEGVEF